MSEYMEQHELLMKSSMRMHPQLERKKRRDTRRVLVRNDDETHNDSKKTNLYAPVVTVPEHTTKVSDDENSETVPHHVVSE